jgi:acyl dehydratase
MLTTGTARLSNRLHREFAPLPRLHFEDFAPGQVFEHGPRFMPRDEMVAFAAEYDPQPMHLDEDAARATMLGGLCASGWFACSILMRMCVEAFAGRSASMGAPGVDEVRWLAPIRPGDQLTFRATVLETRASRSRSDMGLVRFSFDLFNQRGEHGVALTTSMMMGRRENAPRPDPSPVTAEQPKGGP